MRLRRGMLAVLVALTGCSQVRRDPLAAGVARVWPPPPDTPRVRYLGALTGSADFGGGKSAGQVVRELIHGPQPVEELSTPHAVAVHADNRRVAVADPNSGSVHLFDLGRGGHRQLTGPADGQRRLENPVGVCWAGEFLWIADAGQGAIARISWPEHWQWCGDGDLTRPASCVWSAAGERLYVVDAARHEVAVFDGAGRFDFRFGHRGGATGAFNYPAHVALAADGTVLVTDALNARVQRFGPDGTPLGGFGRKGDAAGDFALPKGIAVDGQGTIWVADAQFENVQAFDQAGRLLMHLGGEGRGPGEFWLPAGLHVDRQQRLWVADSYNRRVQVFQLIE